MLSQHVWRVVVITPQHAANMNLVDRSHKQVSSLQIYVTLARSRSTAKPDLQSMFRLTPHRNIWWWNRKQNDGRQEGVRGEKINEENQVCMHFHSRTLQDLSHSQQHVLLVLLENCSDMLEYLRSEQVYSTVDYVTHKCAGLLDIMQHLEDMMKQLWSYLLLLQVF